MSKRLRDLTRFKKTYSYSRQQPINITDLDRRRDVTRFKKTYSCSRQKTVLPSDLVISEGSASGILTETGEFILTESGEFIDTES